MSVRQTLKARCEKARIGRSTGQPHFFGIFARNKAHRNAAPLQSSERHSRSAVGEMGINVALYFSRHAQRDAVGAIDQRVRNKVIKHTRCPSLYEGLLRKKVERCAARGPYVAPASRYRRRPRFIRQACELRKIQNLRAPTRRNGRINQNDVTNVLRMPRRRLQGDVASHRMPNENVWQPFCRLRCGHGRRFAHAMRDLLQHPWPTFCGRAIWRRVQNFWRVQRSVRTQRIEELSIDARRIAVGVEKRDVKLGMHRQSQK